MQTPKFEWTITLGSVLQVVIVLGGMAIAYGTFQQRVEQLTTNVDATQKGVRQIQHYLSGNDPQYWKKVNENGDANDGH